MQTKEVPVFLKNFASLQLTLKFPSVWPPYRQLEGEATGVFFEVTVLSTKSSRRTLGELSTQSRWQWLWRR